ncbi:hypothetical protein [Anaerotruncus colihominis]|uniref:hypothetical protein n=1 Tax=Anaerotruncus colihominis TaxID=169435 RepID=UPI00189B6311|nr:hypothetical protein [Anaerotruncus colihominis]
MITESCEETNEIQKLVTLLTPENKRYVIAVANALIFSQKCEKEDLSQPSSNLTT